jgi:polygalacturonase
MVGLVVPAALVALFASRTFVAPSLGVEPKALYVSPGGRDGAKGTRGDPFRSLDPALRAARGGEQIVVASGSYPAFRDTKARKSTVLVRGVGKTRPAIGKANITGAQNITFDNLSFRGRVTISAHPVLALRQPAQRVTISNSELSTTFTDHCLVIRSGSSKIRVERSSIHDCRAGIGGPGRAKPSKEISIVGNRIERTADGIAFGHWSDVTIEDNVIQHMNDRAGRTHHDALQVFGDVRRLHITRNTMAHSQHQLLIIQAGLGPVKGVTLENNIVYDAGAHAIQTSAIDGLRVVNNTILQSRYGSLLVRRGNHSNARGPEDAVIANNILKTLTFDRTNARVRRSNLILTKPASSGTREIYGRDPDLVAPADGDFRPREGSPASARADRGFAPRLDRAGARRPSPPTIGALEPAD